MTETDRIPRTSTSVLLSEEERRTLRVAAAHRDMTLSTYLRISALERAGRELEVAQ